MNYDHDSICRLGILTALLDGPKEIELSDRISTVLYGLGSQAYVHLGVPQFDVDRHFVEATITAPLGVELFRKMTGFCLMLENSSGYKIDYTDISGKTQPKTDQTKIIVTIVSD